MNESGLEQSVLDRLFEDLNLQLAGAVVRLNGNAEPLASLAQVSAITQRGGVEVRVVLQDRLLHRDAFEWRAKIVALALILDLLRAFEGLSHSAHRFLD